MNKATPGTVIHGTMRTQDLIPAFIAALKQAKPERAAEFDAEVKAALDKHGDAWWQCDDPDVIVEELFEELFDALDEIAPEGHYFGAHPGDGSDYGFWPNDEEED